MCINLLLPQSEMILAIMSFVAWVPLHIFCTCLTISYISAFAVVVSFPPTCHDVIVKWWISVILYEMMASVLVNATLMQHSLPSNIQILFTDGTDRPPTSWRKTWGLSNQTLMPGMWKPGILRVTVAPELSMTFHLMIPLPAIVLEEEIPQLFPDVQVFIIRVVTMW
jgi:hypothetical protein